MKENNYYIDYNPKPIATSHKLKSIELIMVDTYLTDNNNYNIMIIIIIIIIIIIF